MRDSLWKAPETQEAWDALNKKASDMAASLGIPFEVVGIPFDRNSDTFKLDLLASACSDQVLGGECGWERMDFDEFVNLVRRQCAEANRLRPQRGENGGLLPRSPDYVNDGMYADHNMACAVHHYADDLQPAVVNCQTGVFHPSWKAQGEGWQLVQATTKFQRWLLKTFFGVRRY